MPGLLPVDRVRSRRHRVLGLSGEYSWDPPTWAGAFADMGFALMSKRLLDSPLSDVDTCALTAADWSQVRSWRPVGVGETLFNSWD